MKAIVKNGRLILNEPTDLPEGTEVELGPFEEDEFLTSMSPSERAAFEAALDRSIGQAQRGETISLDDLKRELKFRP